jgi:hypothetical protein
MARFPNLWYSIGKEEAFQKNVGDIQGGYSCLAFGESLHNLEKEYGNEEVSRVYAD